MGRNGVTGDRESVDSHGLHDGDDLTGLAERHNVGGIFPRAVERQARQLVHRDHDILGGDVSILGGYLHATKKKKGSRGGGIHLVLALCEV